MFTYKSTTSATLIILLAFAGAPLRAADPPASAPIVAHTYQSVVPLGSDALLIQPASQLVYLLANAGSVGFEGVQRLGDEIHSPLLTPAGQPLRYYPQHIDFVVRASLVKRLLIDYQPYTVSTDLDPRDYLAQLRFQVRIYRGLEVRTLEPAYVTLEDQDDRSLTHRVSFALGSIPLEDRIVLEVLSPDGQRLTKFYMGL